MNWQQMLDNIGGQAAAELKQQVGGLINGAKADGEKFIQDEGAKLERYMNLLATQKITQDEFKSLVAQLADLSAIDALGLAVDAKVRARDLAMKIVNIVLAGVLTILTKA